MYNAFIMMDLPNTLSFFVSYFFLLTVQGIDINDDFPMFVTEIVLFSVLTGLIAEVVLVMFFI